MDREEFRMKLQSKSAVGDDYDLSYQFVLAYFLTQYMVQIILDHSHDQLDDMFVAHRIDDFAIDRIDELIQTELMNYGISFLESFYTYEFVGEPKLDYNYSK